MIKTRAKRPSTLTLDGRIRVRIQRAHRYAPASAALQRFIDEASVRNTIARFADSATRSDATMFRSVWAEDGEFVIGKPPHGQRAVSADAIVAMLGRLRAGKDFFVQFAVP